MSPNNEKPSFMDRSTLLAFALILAFWFGWSKYMETQYPPAEQTAATTVEEQTTLGAAPTGQLAPVEPAAPAPVADAVAENLLEFADGRWSFQVSSRGMGLRDIQLKDYSTRAGESIVLGQVTENYPFATSLIGGTGPLNFEMEKTAPDTFVGRSRSNGLEIVKTMRVNSTNYSVDTDIQINGINSGFSGVVTTLGDRLQDVVSGSLFAPSYDHQDWFVRHDGTRTREILYRESGATVAAGNVSIASISAHYFALAIVDRSELAPRFESRIPVGAQFAVGHLIYQPISRPEQFAVRFTGFAGPKSLSVLSSVDENLTEVIDYGIFAFIAKPLLSMMRFLYSLMGNWGWAIVVLTIIVRLVVLPFNIFSFKSMKTMQKIQPEMTRIREKYKDKSAEQRMQMNQEIMQLMKQHKANPLGGCLPMLLQLPVFIALYSVLSMSIELYMAPFGLWIHDLSVRDPFYVLPVLMGITMYFQTKLTPTTMDPQQQKIMMWMPVIFSFFMLSLPSGLTLYILVSTLFGVIQQWILMRDNRPVPSVKEANA